MRLILTVGLYLAYIRTFCDYLLTGKYSWTPTDPAGLLAHASQLDQVLARPDGLFLCALFAGACFGLAGWLVGVLREVEAWALHAPSHVDYFPNLPQGSMSMRGMSSKQSDVARAVTNSDNWGPGSATNDKTASTPPADPTFSDYVGPADGSATKSPGKKDLPPDQPTK